MRTPIYDELLGDWATPQGPWPAMHNWELFWVWEMYGLERIPSPPQLYHYWVRTVDPKAPGIGDRVIGLTPQEWMEHFANQINEGFA